MFAQLSHPVVATLSINNELPHMHAYSHICWQLVAGKK
jgi:hypothetical protein